MGYFIFRARDRKDAKGIDKLIRKEKHLNPRSSPGSALNPRILEPFCAEGAYLDADLPENSINNILTDQI